MKIYSMVKFKEWGVAIWEKPLWDCFCWLSWAGPSRIQQELSNLVLAQWRALVRKMLKLRKLDAMLWKIGQWLLYRLACNRIPAKHMT